MTVVLGKGEDGGGITGDHSGHDRLDGERVGGGVGGLGTGVGSHGPIIQRGSDNYTGVIRQLRYRGGVTLGMTTGLRVPPIEPSPGPENPDRRNAVTITTGASPTTYRILAGSCAALLLAGVIGAATKDDAEITLDQTAAGDTTTTSAVVAGGDPAAPPAGDPATPDDPAATGVPPTVGAVEETTTTGPTDTAAPAPTTPPPPAPIDQSATPSPVAPGTYRYATQGTMTIGTSSRDLPPETTLTAEQADGDGRQVQSRDMRDANGDGSVTRTTMRYAADGVYLERLVIEFSIGGIGQTSTLTATQPYLMVPKGATPGTETTGVLEGDGIRAAITFTVVSRGADTSAAELLAELTGEVEGRQSSQITARNADLLTVEEKVDSDVRSGGIQVKSNYHASLH